jgi:hypothetical protein
MKPTARIEVIDKVDVIIGELICEIILNRGRDRSKQKRQLRGMGHCKKT